MCSIKKIIQQKILVKFDNVENYLMSTIFKVDLLIFIIRIHPVDLLYDNAHRRSDNQFDSNTIVEYTGYKKIKSSIAMSFCSYPQFIVLIPKTLKGFNL